MRKIQNKTLYIYIYIYIYNRQLSGSLVKSATCGNRKVAATNSGIRKVWNQTPDKSEKEVTHLGNKKILILF